MSSVTKRVSGDIFNTYLLNGEFMSEKKIVEYLSDKRKSIYNKDTEKKANFVLDSSYPVFAKKKAKTGKISLNVSINKAEAAIDSMENNQDIRNQIQAVTRIMTQLDIIRKNSCVTPQKRRMIALFRSILKINCDRKLFSQEHLKEFRNILDIIKQDNINEDKLTLKIEKRLREIGLRTMVSWE